MDILHRSTCRVRVGAVIVSQDGKLLSYGWNHVGDGYGCHAEVHAMTRAPWRMLKNSTIYVAGFRPGKSATGKGNYVNSKPCVNCQAMIDSAMIETVIVYNRNVWEVVTEW
jgi:deoxycytidylate deaminase